MSRNKNRVVFDVLANSSQYKAQMAGVEKTTQKTSRAITAAFAISSIAIAGTLKAFAEYETLLIKVGKTADLQGKELNAFGDEIVKMSAKIPLSTKELLDLAASAAQIGVKGKDNILKFTETVAKLGTATNIVGEGGTLAIARLLNITGEGVDTIGRFGAVITKLGNETAATEREILSIASEVGSSTTQFKLGTVNVLGLSAALASLDGKVEVSGSVIGRIFIEMQKAISGGGEVLEEFVRVTGLTAEEFKQTFEKDATQAFQIFVEGLHDLPEGQFNQSLDRMGIGGVRFNKVLAPLSQNVNILTRSLELARDEAEKQTALNEEFKRAVDSLANSWVFLKTEIFNAAKSMGSDLAPAAKELIKDVTAMVKGIRELNEATGGTITTSVVMAAKISALILVANKLRAVLIATGIVSALFAKQVTAGNLGVGKGIVLNRTFSGTFLTLGSSMAKAGAALKAFQVSLGLFIGGLVIAIDLGKKLGKVLGDLAPDASSEAELIRAREKLNDLLEDRNKLEAKAAGGSKRAAKKLMALNKEISLHEGLVKVLEKEVAARLENNRPSEQSTPSLPGIATEDGAVGDDNTIFKLGQSEKTRIEEEQIELRLAAANREAELMAGIQKGMTDEAIKIAQDRNNQLNSIAEKKAELEKINRDLSKSVIDENEKAILELKKSAAEQELTNLEEKFILTEEKTRNFEAESLEARITAKQLLNEGLTEQELLFLEQKRERDVENREIDLELQATETEEDLKFLQDKLITEQKAKDLVRQEELNKLVVAHNQRLKDEAKFGKSAAKAKAFFRSNEVKATSAVLDTIGQIQTEEGSKAFKVQKGFAIANATMKISEAAVGAFAAMASIPVVGPALAIQAAATAIATGLPALAAIQGATASFAVGTDFVPNDMIANIHQGEGIIPAKQNQFLQSGNLVLGSPEAVGGTSQQDTTQESSTPTIVLNFEGANFIGNVGDNDEFIGQIENAIAIGIDEGRFAGFQQVTVAVT